MTISSFDDGKFLDVNEAFITATGYTREIAIGSTAIEIGWITTEERRRIFELLEKEGRVKNIEINVKCADGSQLFCLYSGEIIEFGGKKRLLSTATDITSRKEIEDDLHEAILRQNEAVQAGNIGLWDWNLDTDKVHYSTIWKEQIGYEDYEIKDDFEEWQSRVHPSDLDTTIKKVRESITQKRPDHNIEFRFRHKDGSYRWILAQASILKDKTGRPVRMLGSHIDITERKKAESAFVKERNYAQKILDTVEAIIVVLDREGRVSMINPKGCRILGYKEEEIKGQQWFSTFLPQPDGMKNVYPFFLKLIDGEIEAAEYFENPIITKDRGIRQIAWHNSLMYGDDGRIAGTLSYGEDITEREEAENELRQQQEKLIESEERFRTVFEQAAVGVARLSPDGFFLEANDKFCEIIGYEKEELHGMTFQQITHPNDLHLDDEHVGRVLEGKIDSFEIEKRYIHKKGHPVWINLYSNVIRQHAGKVKYAIAVVTDISMRKLAEAERERIQTQLNQFQKIESIGNLAGGIAHDFNNILFPIVGMSEMLIEDLPPGSTERENAQEIFKAGKRGSDLVKQILAFSRQAEHKMMPTRIQNVLKEVIKLSRSTIPTYIEIEQDIQQDCGMVLADPSQIHQIGMNLITNAYHAVEDTGGHISIQLKQTIVDPHELSQTDMIPGGYAVLTIADTGHGMSEEQMKKIFDPYFTTKEQGKGTGLGLAVVFGIVKEHKGEITVRSEIGKGSTFDVYLPLMKQNDSTASTTETKEYQGGEERVLLVDDEESITKLEKQMLERMGYEVTSCLHSVEALETFSAAPSSFDLVITDMSMPIMPGDELARKIKSIKPDVPVIICTGFSERISEDNFEQMGIDGLLMKPIIKSELAKMVRKVLDEVKFESQG